MRMNFGDKSSEVATFAELQEQSCVSPRELVEAMTSYALAGWAIMGGVVVELAERSNMSPAALRSIGICAERGAKLQMKGGAFGDMDFEGCLKEASEYHLVSHYVEVKASQIASLN